MFDEMMQDVIVTVVAESLMKNPPPLLSPRFKETEQDSIMTVAEP